jgi:peptide/nickel transport system substrate-binding protein
MREKQIRGLVEKVRDGEMSRRDFVQRMMAWGLSVPIAGHILLNAGVASAAWQSDYKQTKRGGGGHLRLLWWQGPTLLNPHFAIGTKDQDGSRLFYEPLAGWDPDGNLLPFLASDIPSVENGGLDKDGKFVIWKLKQNVKWHDGQPFTADDCVFNAEYASNPEVAATTIGAYKGAKVSKVDDFTVRLDFEKPTPFWADALVGTRGMLIPKHLFEKFAGSNSRDAPTNLAPVGTGPYIFESFNPGDLIKGKINPDYYEDNKPHFDSFEMKGGGDAVSAARAVLQTGEYDFAWNLQVEDDLLKRLEEGGKGKTVIADAGDVEMIQLNPTDPWKEVDGERSSIQTKHPFLSDIQVRKALNLLVDRASMQQHIYGRAGPATASFLNNPEKFRSKNTSYEFNIDKAIALLEEAGWKPGADGIREKDGVKLKILYQTSINGPRQKIQAIVKQAFQKAGIETELKSVTASVFFSSDVANPDTYGKFYSDIQMYTTTMVQADPKDFMLQFTSAEVSSKANKWQGRNICRWRSAEYDKLYDEAQNEVDPVKRADLFIQMNDLVIADVAVIPVVGRPKVAGVANNLYAPLSGWDNYTWSLRDWYRIS